MLNPYFVDLLWGFSMFGLACVICIATYTPPPKRRASKQSEELDERLKEHEVY